MDKYGKIVLNVHYINESAVKNYRTFVYPSTTISIDEHEGSIRVPRHIYFTKIVGWK